MTKLWKTLAGLLLLAVAAALLAPLLIDPNDFRDEIIDGFAAVTGRELQIAGGIEVSLLPVTRVEIREASLAGDRAVTASPLAEIGVIRLRPRLAPLLAGRLELAPVRIEGLRLRLIRDEQGRANWGGGVERADAPDAPAAGTRPGPRGPAATAPPEPTAIEAPPAPARLVVGGVEIVDARVTWDDRQTGGRLELGALEISTGPLSPGAPLDLRLTGSVIDGEGRATAGLRAEARLLAAPGGRALRLEPLKLGLAGLKPIDDLEAKLDLTTELEADLRRRRYRVGGLDLRLEAEGEALSGGRLDAVIGARGELDLSAGTLRLEGLSVRSDELVIDGHLSGEGLLAAPTVRGRLALQELDLRSWLEARGLPVPATADPRTLRRVGLEADWRLADDRLALSGLALTLDDTRVTGSGEVTRSPPVGYRFDLAGDRLDLDRYLPARPKPPGQIGPEAAPAAPDPAAVADEPAAAPPPGTASEPRPGSAEEAGEPIAVGPIFPVEALRALDLDGRVRLGELRLAGLALGDAFLEIASGNGELRIGNRIDRFYGGRAQGALRLDVRGALPTVSLTQHVGGAAVGPLLGDLTGRAALTGTGNIEAELRASGRNSDALRGSLGGRISLALTRGSVQGFNLVRLVREAQAGLTGKAPPGDLPNQTDFSTLTASGEIQGGILTNRDLAATADYLRVTGAGTLDLGRERFDYRFEPVFTQTPDALGVKGLEGIPVPVRLTGPFERPRWDVDAASALRAVAERELRSPEGGLFRKLEERTGIKGLEQGLRGLFGR
jgi:AsmA protein